jgi:hypothetical protein
MQEPKNLSTALVTANAAGHESFLELPPDPKVLVLRSDAGFTFLIEMLT